MPQKLKKPSSLFIISLLGALSVVTPFTIDMYLPAFPQVAKDFGVESTTISLTLSSYFIGMSFGQLLYGPLLDRFGRKIPLCIGLCIYIVASIACAFAPGIYTLIGARFVQALGGCAAGVASLAMVRDFFPAKESAKILSRLFLFIAVSPLLAPTVGGAIMLAFSWHTVFLMLAFIVALITVLIYLKLPEGHKPDKSISLKPLPIIREYWTIVKHPRFITYSLAGAFSFAGLFTYVAGSPIIFMENYKLSAQVYSMIFAGLASGFIGGSQVNVQLLKKYDSQTIFFGALIVQVVAALVFAVGTYFHLFGLVGTLAMFYIFLSCCGITYPNAAGTAMGPFTKNAGSASAMLGFLQLGVGAFISTGISAASPKDSFPIIAILATTSTIGLIIMLIGRKRANAKDCSHE